MQLPLQPQIPGARPLILGPTTIQLSVFLPQARDLLPEYQASRPRIRLINQSQQQSQLLQLFQVDRFLVKDHYPELLQLPLILNPQFQEKPQPQYAQVNPFW